MTLKNAELQQSVRVTHIFQTWGNLHFQHSTGGAAADLLILNFSKTFSTCQQQINLSKKFGYCSDIFKALEDTSRPDGERQTFQDLKRKKAGWPTEEDDNIKMSRWGVKNVILRGVHAVDGGEIKHSYFFYLHFKFETLLPSSQNINWICFTHDKLNMRILSERRRCFCPNLTYTLSFIWPISLLSCWGTSLKRCLQDVSLLYCLRWQKIRGK